MIARYVSEVAALLNSNSFDMDAANVEIWKRTGLQVILSQRHVSAIAVSTVRAECDSVGDLNIEIVRVR